MKLIFFLLALCATFTAASQSLELQYDPRHTWDRRHHPRNFASLYFEYFKTLDSGKGFIQPGSFLLKTQVDFAGLRGNINQFYGQISQTLKMGKGGLYLNLQYSGGLGVTEPKQYSYYLTNTYGCGVARPFHRGNAWFSAVLNLQYTANARPSLDPQYTLYWWKGLWKNEVECSGDFSAWTLNRNHGDALTSGSAGKAFYFFAEPHLRYNFSRSFSAGSTIYFYYHVLSPLNRLQVYPVATLRWKL